MKKKKKKKNIVAETLNRGKDRATKKQTLMNYFGLTERELYAQIERERLNGMAILAKKTEGGGYYLPASLEEKKEYLALLKRSIQAHQSVYDAIENEAL